MKKNVRPDAGTLLRGIFNHFEGDFEKYNTFVRKLAGPNFYDSDKLDTELRRCWNEPPPSGRERKSSGGRLAECKRNYRSWLIKFGTLHKIPMKHFEGADKVLTPEDFEKIAAAQEESQSLELNKKDEQVHQHFADVHLNNLRTALYVADPLDHQSFQYAIHANSYIRANKKCYDKIKEVVEQRQQTLHYIRLLTLPMAYNFEGKSDFDILTATVDHASLELLKHMVDIIRLQDTWETPFDKPYGFFVASRLVGMDHFALVNKGEVIFNEFGAYIRPDDFSPLLMDIDASGKSKMKYKKLYKSMMSVVDEPNTLELNDIGLLQKCLQSIMTKLNDVQPTKHLKATEKRRALMHKQITSEKLAYVNQFLDA